MDSSKADSPEELSDVERRVGLRKAAALIGRSYPTTLKIVNSGKLRSIKIGNQHEITLGEIRRFLQEGNWVEPKEQG